MTEYLQRFRVPFREDAQLSIFFQRAGEIDEVAVAARRQRRLCQSRADAFRHLQGSGAARHLLGAAIRQLDGNGLRHKLFSLP